MHYEYRNCNVCGSVIKARKDDPDTYVCVGCLGNKEKPHEAT
jgi:hypothetical protein